MPTTTLKGLGDELAGFVKRLPDAQTHLLSGAAVTVAEMVHEVAPIVSGAYVSSEGVSGAGGKAVAGGFAPLTPSVVRGAVGDGTRAEVGNEARHAPLVEKRHQPHAAGVAALEAKKVEIGAEAFEIATGDRR